MPNRYTRDQLISIALQQVQLPNLEIHDMPDGVVRPDAFCIQWLQDILDFWHHMMPFSATVDYVPLYLLANVGTVILPDDFILDVKHGLCTPRIPSDLQTYQRLYRVPLQKFINRSLGYQKATNVKSPYYYCVIGDDGDPMSQRQTMQVAPVQTQDVSAMLWYYKLPPPLQAGQKPKFPNDYVCTEYLRIRALEWAHIYDPGTAQKFCDKIVTGMKVAGLMNEPEDDEIPFDLLSQRQIGPELLNTYGWMGER